MRLRLDAFDEDQITLRPAPEQRGFLSRIAGRAQRSPELSTLTAADRSLALAIADLRALAEERGARLDIGADAITLDHALAAAVDAKTGQLLGLPALTNLTLFTDVEGVLGTPGFRLRCTWQRSGRRVTPGRTGAILHGDPPTRLPDWMLGAVELADGWQGSRDDAEQWEKLARFRQALEPGVTSAGEGSAARLAMTDFLSGLRISLVDAFTILPDATGENFDVMPFAARPPGDDYDDAQAQRRPDLDLDAIALFQRKQRERGVLNAFQLERGRYLVIDRSAAPALRVMSEMQRATPEERSAFIANPRARITEATEEALRARGDLDGLERAEVAETIEAAAAPVFVETEEFLGFSARVTGRVIYDGNPLATAIVSGTTWLPESFGAEIAKRLSGLSKKELEIVGDNLRTAIASGVESVPHGDVQLPATPELLNAVEARISSSVPDDTLTGEPEQPRQEERGSGGKAGPIILETINNIEDVGWRPGVHTRYSALSDQVPHTITTPLKQHQRESFAWQISAWQAGLPGILNADEQGLGKTLQTIAFLVWLNEHMKTTPGAVRGPVLVVAPTSLLRNWEEEVARHVASPGLGHLIRLYGSTTPTRRRVGARGMETENGEAKLDFGDLERAAAANAGHLTWVLTTYDTLTNYQHSLGRIPFVAVVFDEVQALKNPGTLRSNAARAVKADFRIGLTGTPIENATTDLWAVMEALAPGELGSLQEFRDRYSVPDETNMEELHARVFQAGKGAPALALRRLKDEVARDLPAKTRFLHPRLMPAGQAEQYDQARAKLRAGGRGGALKVLHHIRGVSLHPHPDMLADDREFILASARFEAAFDILRHIRSTGERALVFIEDRKLQHRFIEIAKSELGLARIDLINGATAIPRRQAIVRRFQGHLDTDAGFDLLVLGPKAAGTGLTLTAATHVIHLSRWWNPAVEEQCNDRVHRIGQTRPVTVYAPVAVHPGYREHSFDLLLQSLMQRKRHLARKALWPMGDTDGDAGRLREMLAAGVEDGGGDPLADAISAAFRRDQLAVPPRRNDGGYCYD